MAKDSSLIKLATGGNKKTVPVKKAVAKVAEKVLTPEEARDVKAKEKVKELLEGVNLSLKPVNKEDELFEIENEPKGSEWLQEQVSLLASENQNLKNELEVAKESYTRIFTEFQNIKGGAGIVDDGVLKSQVVKLFHEIQSNYVNMGKNQYTGEPYFRIVPGAFLNRMIQFFPFLQQEKKF